MQAVGARAGSRGSPESVAAPRITHFCAPLRPALALAEMVAQVAHLLEVVFPSSSSAASAQYYLMLFELTLFLLPLLVRGGPTLDALYRLWFVQWALPATLLVSNQPRG